MVAVTTPTPLQEVGLEISRWAQEALAFLTPLMQGVTALGDEEFYLFVFPLLFWSISRSVGIHLGLILLASASLNAGLKLAFHSPRPFWFEPGLAVATEPTFGAPSGHAQNAVAVWGLLAHDVRRHWGAGYAIPVAAVLVIAIGWSRVHLGVHFVEDVLLGWLVGAALLVGYVALREPVSAWLDRRPVLAQVAVGLGVSVGLVALAVGFQVAVDPQPGEAATLAPAVNAAGALFGFVAGLLLIARPVGFSTDGSVWQRVARYPIGFVGVGAIWIGLGAALPGGDGLLHLALRYLRYGLVGLWIGGLAPWVFVRVGLAPRQIGPARGR